MSNENRPVDRIVASHAAGKRGQPQSARGPPTDDAFDDGVDAYSIRTFCRRHGISESFYHKLQSQGLGPKTMRVGTRVLITREAARAWRKQRTEASAI